MKLSCIIIDDEPDAHELLQLYCARIPWVDVKGHFYDALSAKLFLDKIEVDFLFLDIHLPQINGFEFLKLLPKQPKVIFVTAHSNHSLEAFDFHVIDYLLKPVRLDRFIKAISKVGPTEVNPPTLPDQVRLSEGEPFINPKEVEYVEAFGNYIKVYFNTKMVLLHATLKQAESQLKPYQFIRIHKSYLVNEQAIIRLDDHACQLGDNRSLPIGISYRQQVKDLLKK